MRVKVTPPYEGAGSFEAEVSHEIEGHYITNKGDWFLKAHCTEIPSITPEPGDIVEGDGGVPFYYHPEKTYTIVKKIVARKPKVFEEARRAIYDFRASMEDCKDDYTEYNLAVAYETFLRAILGVPYGRVDK